MTATAGRRLLLFDDLDIRRHSGFHPVAGPVEKLGVVLEPERPWEGDDVLNFAGTVIQPPGGGWRLYYSARPNGRMVVAVAESGDGRQWHRPRLGQQSWEDEDTNLLAIAGLPPEARCTQPQVLRLPDDSWRMYFWLHAPEEGMLRYLVAESENGIEWRLTDIKSPAIYHPADKAVKEATTKGVRLRSNDATYVYFDGNQFLMYSVWLLPNPVGSHRRVEHDNAAPWLRVIHLRVSNDGLHFSEPELLITPDEHDPLDQQFYYLSREGKPGDWVGCLGHYRVWEQTMDIELCFSRDGRRWHRPLRGGWIPRDPVPAPDCMGVYAGNRALNMGGDQRLMLYTATNVRHNRQAPEGIERSRRCIMAAAFTPGRQFALRARGGVPGRLESRPFILGDQPVTVDANVDGALRAELCDAFGAPLPGFALRDCQPLTGDDRAHTLCWAEGATTCVHAWQAVTLRLEIVDGALHGITV